MLPRCASDLELSLGLICRCGGLAALRRVHLAARAPLPMRGLRAPSPGRRGRRGRGCRDAGGGSPRGGKPRAGCALLDAGGMRAAGPGPPSRPRARARRSRRPSGRSQGVGRAGGGNRGAAHHGRPQGPRQRVPQVQGLERGEGEALPRATDDVAEQRGRPSRRRRPARASGAVRPCRRWRSG